MTTPKNARKCQQLGKGKGRGRGNPAATRGHGCSAVWRGPRGACDMLANQQQAEIPKNLKGWLFSG